MENWVNIINDLRQEVKDDKIIALNNRLVSLINLLLLDIRDSININAARKFFLILENIQNELAKFLFREEGYLLPQLKKFIRDFDRVDDDRTISILFELIKENNYRI